MELCARHKMNERERTWARKEIEQEITAKIEMNGTLATAAK